MNEWISVLDQLPDQEVPVLVTYVSFADGVTLHADGIANIRYGGWCWYEDSSSDNDEEVKVEITAWMHLPSPYEPN